MAQVPETFKAARIVEYGKPLQVDTVHTPELQNGKFLIRVEASPINPSDAFMEIYHYLVQVIINYLYPGCETSGVIVKFRITKIIFYFISPRTPDILKVGQSCYNSALYKGTYAEYLDIVTNSSNQMMIQLLNKVLHSMLIHQKFSESFML